MLGPDGGSKFGAALATAMPGFKGRGAPTAPAGAPGAFLASGERKLEQTLAAPAPALPAMKFRNGEEWREYVASGGTRLPAPPPTVKPPAPLGAPLMKRPPHAMPAMQSRGASSGMTRTVASLTPPAVKGYAQAGPGAMVSKIERAFAPHRAPLPAAKKFKGREHYRDFIASGGTRV